MMVSTVIAQLRTTNLKDSIHFYTAQLGFELDFEFSDFYAGIKVADGQFIHLKLVDDKDPSINYVRSNGHLHLFFSIDDADAAAAQFRVKGVSFHAEPNDTAWGTREFHVYDDQGHVLCFAQDTAT